jgi:hypothetical protein
MTIKDVVKRQAFHAMEIHVHNASALANALLMAIEGFDKPALDEEVKCEALEVLAYRVSNETTDAWKIWKQGAGISEQ